MSEGRMVATSLRLPAGQLKRAEKLRDAIKRKDRLRSATGVVTRSAVLQLAIERGLEALEAEYKS